MNRKIGILSILLIAILVMTARSGLAAGETRITLSPTTVINDEVIEFTVTIKNIALPQMSGARIFVPSDLGNQFTIVGCGSSDWSVASFVDRCEYTTTNPAKFVDADGEKVFTITAKSASNEGQYDWNIYVRNGATGDWNYRSEVITNVDSTPPTVSVTVPEGWITDDFDASVTFRDGIGLEACYYCYGAMCEDGYLSWKTIGCTETKQEIKVPEECSQLGVDACKVNVAAKDLAGQVTVGTATKADIEQKPTATVSISPGWRTDASEVVADVVFSDNSNIVSCAYKYYSTAGWSDWLPIADCTALKRTILIPDECDAQGVDACKVQVKAVDDVSLFTESMIATADIDYTSPDTPVIANLPTYTNGDNLKLDVAPCIDSTSGVKDMTIRRWKDNVALSDLTGKTCGTVIKSGLGTLTTGSEYKFQVVVYDNAGNSAESNVVTTKYDNELPTVTNLKIDEGKTVTYPAGTYETNPFTIDTLTAGTITVSAEGVLDVGYGVKVCNLNFYPDGETGTPEVVKKIGELTDLDNDGIYTGTFTIPGSIAEFVTGWHSIGVECFDYADNSNALKLYTKNDEGYFAYDKLKPIVKSISSEGLLYGLIQQFTVEVCDNSDPSTVNFVINGLPFIEDRRDDIFIDTIDGTAYYCRNFMYTVAFDSATTYNFAIVTTDIVAIPSEEYSGTFDIREKYEITLNQGWNLVSLPIIPMDANENVDKSLENVLDLDNSESGIGISDSTRIRSVNAYNPFASNNDAERWKVFTNDQVANDDLTTIEDGKGYWVYVTEGDPITLTVRGEEALPAQTLPSYLIKEGWNLIGAKTTCPYVSGENDGMNVMLYFIKSVKDLADVLAPKILTSYDGTAGYRDVDTIYAGKGYWYYANRDQTLIPPLGQGFCGVPWNGNQ